MLDKSFSNWLTVRMDTTDTYTQLAKGRAYLQTLCREAGISDFTSMSMKQMQHALTLADQEIYA